ncbi:MAG TPA: pitrilysin family protein [Hyphomicrobiaceae bacterium]|nr:pitrilysin family protein [Hyphomicrobiaceae bacterium]
MKIQEITSPGGIKGWLVEERKVPLLAFRFVFEGGGSEDPIGKEGVAELLATLLDEGAGDLDAQKYQERMEELAMRMSFEATDDAFYGTFQSLTANRDASVEMLRLALAKPRLDAEAIERMRKQKLANLAYALKNPSTIAGREWAMLAYPNHLYSRLVTEKSVAAITRDDIETVRRKVFAREKLVAVGDISAKDFGLLLDKVFGELAVKANITPIPPITIPSGAKEKIVEFDVPQSVVMFGMAGIPRNDPDFIPAFVMNEILGGGGFHTRLMEEVREKRGLAYGVSSYLQTLRASNSFGGRVATKNESVGQSIDIIRAELKRMAEGPTEKELADIKSYLIGSYPLRFDTNAKIANVLLGVLYDDLGIDYVDKRNKLIEAVTVADIKRVAARLLKPENMITVIVGKPKLPGRG